METGWSSEATSYVTLEGIATDENPEGYWRHGRCLRCSKGFTMAAYLPGAERLTRVPPRTCDPKRNYASI
jgi:hypothetical protein